MDIDALESLACTPVPLDLSHFNPRAVLPYGLSTAHIHAAMQSFLDFLGFVNGQLNTKNIRRLECFIMQANFSSMVGEFVKAHIPIYCPTLVVNKYHNGHPDLLPANTYPNDAMQHADQGVEVKGSRYMRGWQGHNPENTWLMVFIYDSNSPHKKDQLPIRPFKFKMVLGAQLAEEDWMFSGRREGSKRTITASVRPSGYEKMMANWIYRDPDLDMASIGRRKRSTAQIDKREATHRGKTAHSN